ncbi:MAG: peptidylprolyl isomerase [Gammaproteobacteria bacterium]|nr:peptidylprolyl isomerase [Gammaproteobacteria bacterium]
MLPSALTNLVCHSHLPHNLVLVFLMLSTMPVNAVEPEEVLIVGDEHFLRFELDDVINRFVPAAVFHGGITKEKRKKYIPRAVDVLIDRALLYRGAQQAGIEIDPTKIETVVEKNIQQFGSKEKFEAALSESGLTLERFKHRIVQQNAINQYVQSELIEKSHYSDKDLRAYYDEHTQEFQRPESMGLWHITLTVKPNAPESAWLEKKKLADDIVKRIKNGEDFAVLAGEFSDDDYRVKGGWIGYMHKGRLLMELEERAFELNKDEVAEPIRSLQGYHIIKAGDRKQAGVIAFDEAKVGLKQRLEKDRFERLRTELLNKLKKNVEIKVLVDMT